MIHKNEFIVGSTVLNALFTISLNWVCINLKLKKVNGLYSIFMKAI